MKRLISLALVGCTDVTAFDLESVNVEESCEPRERILHRELLDLPADGSPRQQAAVCPQDTRLVTGGCIGNHGVHVFFSIPEAIQDGEEPTEIEPNGWACGAETTDGFEHVLTAQVLCEFIE